MDHDYHGARVVHAASYQFAKDGAAFFNCDLKFHQGLVQNGCYVYPFSINDRARMLSLGNSKTFGKGRANRALLRTCQTIRPDALILGHGQYITRKTLEAIRDSVSGIRIGYWYIDPLWEPRDVAHLHHRADLFDAICCTTGGELLREFCRPGSPAAFIPNPVEAGIERYRAFECKQPEYDVVFFGRDKYAPQRRDLLLRLQKALPDVQFGIFGCLGNPLVFGAEKESILARSRMGLNLSRRTDVSLYSSDRIAQLTGNGLLTLVHTGAGFEELYDTDEIGFYDSFDSLVELISRQVADDNSWRGIAQRGWHRAHTEYSSQRVMRFILDLTFRRPEYERSPWAQFVWWNAQDSTRRTDHDFTGNAAA